ncbi:MAG: hypothetical protein K6V73_11820, partial [Firmicutes bacterium]|nr:hypothetical protein [Bacillota bacterium]
MEWKGGGQAEMGVRRTGGMDRRTLRRLLGGLWLLDGMLQLQPGMWTMNMVNQTMVQAAGDQPAPLAHLIIWGQTVVTAHLVAFNAGVAGIQIVLGLWLLSGRRPRPALAASVAWALAVWLFGEGLGDLLTGGALVATGAPGAVVLYAALALLAWPADAAGARPAPVAARAAAGLLAAVWLLGAALDL